MLKAHDRSGRPFHMVGPMPSEEVRAKAAELWGHGYARITLTNTDTLSEIELGEFDHRKPGA